MFAVPVVAVSTLEDDSGTSLEQVPCTVAAGTAAESAAFEGVFSQDFDTASSEFVPEHDVSQVFEGDGVAEMLPSPVPLTPGEQSAPPTMSLLKMEEKFSSGQYRAIEDFVSDFRAMLEEFYRLHGADQWLSKQAQKLELLLEQKLSLLSRTKTLATRTSKNGCALNDDKESACTSTRRRSSTRTFGNLNTGAMESVMVQVLKQAEFLRAKEEKRIKEQEKKEAEEAIQKEMEKWDRSLLALAEPTCMETMWEIPAIGHFLCLAQQVLNLPEIVFYELERCLLMPQCNVFLAKIMTSLLSPPHRRPTLHRRQTLPYKAWEAALRQKVQQWYTVIGQAENPDRCAEKLGLCSQFFKVLGEVSPLDHKTFHELTFCQKVWLLKGLCDFVYETQSEVQDAVLGQPIHECREVILGYDAQENAYIHFPQFCGADVRVYKQRPFKAPSFPIPPIKIKRTPRLKLNRSKCKYAKKSNGEVKASRTDMEKCFVCHDDCSVNCQMANCNSSTEHNVQPNCEHEDHSPCDTNKTASCEENLEKPISPGELVGYGEPLSPGEIRILENVEKYAEATLLKADTNPLKENALKTYQVHVNGNHMDNTEVICHQVAMDIILDHSLLNHKKAKLHKMRTKKKNKKKITCLINENLQGKCEGVQMHTFKCFKTEIHSKLYLNKKRDKHKKHKSGKKSVSKKTIVKKKKIAATSPAAPQFQLICTNLDDLRELIKKIDGEFKSLDNNKKKSGKWHTRRQGVKELHSTLTRLLNELLPWEPKLLKAFQRNRARLRKDYDDFQSLTFSENLAKESGSHEDCEADKSPVVVAKPIELGLQEIQRKDHIDKLEISEMDVCGKEKLPIKNLISKEFPVSPAKGCKRQYKQCSHVDNEELEPLPRKTIKLSAHEVLSPCSEEQPNTTCFLEDCQQIETESPEINTEITGISKGAKPIQALLARNIGNKVTLRSHLAQSVSKTVPSPESTATSSGNHIPVKSAFPCQATSKAPLQMIYKLPDGQCIPIDLRNSPVKIHVQPVIDAKTGDKLMQQFLLLPKNIFIQEKDEKTSCKGHSDNVPLSITSTGCGNTDNIAQFTTALNKSIVHSAKCSSLISQPPVSTLASNRPATKSERNHSSSLVLPNNFPTSVVSSSVSQPVHSDVLGVASTTDNTVMASQIVNTLSVQQNVAPEAKQELKTVCIRDSQSILVRTRGGNTGVVTVQPSQDQSTSVPNSVFSFTPQLQSFLVSRPKTSASSTFVSVTPSHLSPGIQAPQLSSDSGGINHLPELNTKSIQEQHPSPARVTCQTTEKHLHPSSFITTVSPGSWLPANSNGNANCAAGIVNISTCNTSGQGMSSIKKTTIDLKQSKIGNISTVQPDSTTHPKSDLVSGSSLHKVMLFSPPPLLPSGNVPKISLLNTPTSAVNSQKFVFINTQVPTTSSSTNVALQGSTQGNPTKTGNTYVKPPEQSQIILIPSTMGSSLKMSSAPIVSQVKDVKMGLSIGQTIVNTVGSIKNVLPINILQNTLGKGIETISKEIVCKLPTTKGLVANAVVTTPAVAGTLSNVTERSGKGIAMPLSASSNTLCSSNRGSAVAISTVKTGHLSSSLLFSTTQMCGHENNTLSSLQMPAVNATYAASSHIGTTSMAVSYQPLPNDLIDTTQYSSEIFSKTLSTHVTKPQAGQTPLVPTLCKSVSGLPASQVLPPLSSTASNPLKPQLDDSCIHQKLVINTSTPLAPGTQLTINGIRLIVPPQGLRAGSHVLLISTNPKQSPSLAGNSVQMCNGSPLENKTVQLGLRQNMSPVQPPGQPKSMNSLGTSNILPFVQPAAKIVHIPPKNVSPCPITSLDSSSSITAPQPFLVPCMQRGSYPQPNNLTHYSRETPVKEGVILNMVNPPGNLFPAPVISENKMADNVLTLYQSSASEKPNTVAS